MADDVTPVVAALRKSGFPLQTRVQHEIQKRALEWTLAAVEHPWRDPDAKDQFVDLMAYCGDILPVIECKKAQERSLLFLRPVELEYPGIVCLERLTRAFFVPVIVTTASLFTLRFQPTEVELDTGAFANLDPKRIESIPWVRFHKTLTASSDGERTVLVVNAGALPAFLDEISRWQNPA